MSSQRNSGTVLLINENAGGVARAAKEEWAAQVADRLDSAGWKVNVCSVAASGIHQELHRAVAAAPEALIVGGGDGTILSAVSAIGERGIPLGVIPMGTFNSLARDLHIPLQWEGAVDVIAQRQIREIDVAMVNNRPFMSLCVIGFLATPECSEGEGRPWWWKAMRNLRLAVSAYARYPAMHLRVETETTTGCLKTRLAAVANNSFRDESGLKVPLRQEVDSGRLTVYLSKHSSQLEVMRAGLAFLMGRLSDDPNLTILSARSAAISARWRRHLAITLDGEVVREALPLRFRMHPKQLRVFSGGNE
jgi:diacylglycerol kinase family enzyme